MNEVESNAAIRTFAAVARLSEQLCSKGDRSAPILCTLFAMWCALKIRLSFGDEDPKEPGAEPFDLIAGSVALPRADSVQKAAESLIATISLHDQARVSCLLEEMGVTSLCPNVVDQLAKMRQLVDLLNGRAQLIPLVELSRFAVEMEDYEKAALYASEARSLGPEDWELYSLCIVDGLVALERGDMAEAIRSLSESVNSCQYDEFASLACSVRAIDLTLATKLLIRGRRSETSAYLERCKDVWQSLRPQIDVWIRLIESGESPDFNSSSVLRLMDGPLFRLKMQAAKAHFIEANQHLPSKYRVRKSRAEVLAGRERLRAEYGRGADGPGFGQGESPRQ